MVPTYFRRELRDRVLQRRSRLRTFVLFVCLLLRTILVLPRARSSYPRKRVSSTPRRCRLMTDVSEILDRPAHKAGDDGRTRSRMTASLSKADLRTAALAKRDALNDEQRAAAAQAMAKRGLPFKFEPGMVISGYSP